MQRRDEKQSREGPWKENGGDDAIVKDRDWKRDRSRTERERGHRYEVWK
jgi:hypothetical protein